MMAVDQLIDVGEEGEAVDVGEREGSRGERGE